MEKLITYLYATFATAKNAHYREGGVSFYANHLLADLHVEKLIDYADDIFEVYYLGKAQTPPDLKAVFLSTQELIPPPGAGNLILTEQLKNIIEAALGHIAELNSVESLTVGEANLVGNIAQDLQQWHGLLGRVLADG